MKIGDTVKGYRLITRLDRGGSERQYFRCTKGNTTFIMVLDQDIETYIELYHHLYAKGISVPRIYGYDLEQQLMIQEDLGDTSLFVLSRAGKDLSTYYQQTIDELIKLQVDARQNTPVGCRYDREHILWEQEYFRDFFLDQYCGIAKTTILTIAEDLKKLADEVLAHTKPISDYLMHRDFQSQNIYIKNGRIRIIDFQSARIGPLTYDLSALLRDAYVQIPPEQEKALLVYYMQKIKARGLQFDETEFSLAYELTCLQRNMQALGAFANLSLNRGKPHFKQYIPRGLELLKYGLQKKSFSELDELVSNIEI
jgi:aminoglycoside/choline kinase family phosphotransferase